MGFGPNFFQCFEIWAEFPLPRTTFPNNIRKIKGPRGAESSRWMKGSLNLGNPSKLLFCCEGMVYQNLLWLIQCDGWLPICWRESSFQNFHSSFNFFWPWMRSCLNISMWHTQVQEYLNHINKYISSYIYHLEYDGICVYPYYYGYYYLLFSMIYVMFTMWNTLGIFATMETKKTEPTTTLPVGNISCNDRPLVPYRTG